MNVVQLTLSPWAVAPRCNTAFAASCLASAGTLTPEPVAYFSEEHPGRWTGFTPLHEG
jgi:hypothetical protein